VPAAGSFENIEHLSGKAMKKIMLFARDPGGANAIAPLAPKLKLRGYDVLLYGKDAALRQYLNNGLEGRDFAVEAPFMGVDEYVTLLQRIAPDFMITGTGSDDLTEKFLWQAAEYLQLPCFAILDHWFNYGIRFSPYKLVEQKLYERDRRHPYLPTKILVMDEEVRGAMIREGFEPDRLRVAGQPHFDAVREQAMRYGSVERRQYRELLGLNENEFLIAFISENITEPEKGDDLRQYYWGYTERSIFREFMDALQAVSDAVGRKVHVVVKPHPNETIDAYSDLIAEQAGGKVTASIDSSAPSVRLCKAVDLVCGMSSMVLVESVILGLPVISIQIGLTRENPFILDQKGIVQSVLNQSELREKLAGYMTGTIAAATGFNMPTGSADRIIEWMEEWL